MTSTAIEKWKLNGEQKLLMIQLLADFKGNNEIIEYFKENHNIEITQQAVTYYKQKYERDIIKIRETFNDRILAIPVANKFKRIEIRQHLCEDLLANLWLEEIKIKKNQIAYDNNGKPITSKFKANHEIINKILDSIRAELEPLKIQHSGDLTINSKIIEIELKADDLAKKAAELTI